MLILLSAGLLAIVYVLYGIVYRLYLHPLVKFPGPWQAAISNWYAAFHVWRGNSHLMIWDGHQQYGDIARCGPNFLSVNTRSGMATIYATGANVRKDDGYMVMSASLHAPNTISSIDKQAHAFKRRILSQVFTASALKGVEDRILLHTRRLCDMLYNDTADSIISDSPVDSKSSWGPTKDMAALSDYVAFDVISDLCYGKSFGMLESDRYRSITKITTMLSRRNAVCFVQSKLWRYKLDRVFFASLLSPIKDFGAWIRQQAKARTKLGNDVPQKDCFHYMLNAKDPDTGQPFTERELWTESLQLIVAVHNPIALATLTNEIRSCFQSEEDILLGVQLNSCTFLRACINESLRLSPPFAGLPTRRVLPGGITVDGHYIPEGTVIGTPIYAIHHDERYYCRPFKYAPERWIEEDGDHDDTLSKQNIKLAKAAFCPFSIGPRSCVAKNMAWAELTLIIARIVFRYDMRLPPEHAVDEPECCSWLDGETERSPEYRLKAWIASGREGPLIQFRPRSDCS
ncbi:hypothetical protein MW887_007188 [Aspergillus wentii]|nr:hypothetical protein MW887_007188 [Aspergillus wentii]